jgi:hypothetical protein
MKLIDAVPQPWQVKKNVVTAEISSADASAEQHRLRRVMK